MKGGNRANRQKYSKDYIKALVDDYKQNGNALYNPQTKKYYDNYTTWYVNLVFWMDKPSVNYFFYLLEEPHYSKFSGEKLTEESFSYSSSYKGYKGWKKYTPEETKLRVWTKFRDYNITDNIKSRISNTLKLFNSSDAGIANRKQKSKRMKKFYNTVEGIQHKHNCCIKSAKTLRAKIASGDYMPNITNTWTHWDAKIILEDGVEKKFRSSWEACFWYCNQHCKYETIRVKTSKKVYVSDFYDEDANILYEIKPRNRYNKEIEKMLCLQKYCDDNNIKFKWINENNISQYIDESKFTGVNIEQLKMMKKAYDQIKN